VHKPARKTLEFLDTDGKLRTMESIEHEVIKFAVLHTPTINAAAKALGIGRSTLYRKLNEARTARRNSSSTSPHKAIEHRSV
jgi:DNA-binding NtrC family response regulator